MKLPEDRSEIRLAHDPQNPHRTIIHQVLERDIAGWSQKKIAEDLGYVVSWISRIQNAPFYQGLKSEKLKNLHEKVIEKVATHIVDADKILNEAKPEAANTLLDIMRSGRSEAVRAQVAERIVDGGKAKGGVNVVVQINEKLGDRLEKVLRYDEGRAA